MQSRAGGLRISGKCDRISRIMPGTERIAAMTRIFLPLALIVVMSPALALNMSGFKDAPITRLTGEELRAFRAAVMKALDNAPEGTTVEWKAPKTLFVSKITPVRNFTHGKLKCREATIESDARDRYQRGLYSFCKAASGEWQFKTPGARSKAK
jgi:surface antigen